MQRNASVSYLWLFYFNIDYIWFYLRPIRFTFDYIDFILDYMNYTLDYTEIHASNWSEAQSAQSREIALRWILIRDVCVLSSGNFALGMFRL